MKIVKKINNNVAVGIDGRGHELIVFGKGVGFPSMPYELTDLKKIERTFYGISDYYLKLLEEIPEPIFRLSARIVDYARKHIRKEFSPNILFTLADHIQFVAERYEKHLLIHMPFSNDIQFLYEEEMDAGNYAVKLMTRELKIPVSVDEAYSIALHFINSENMLKETGGKPSDEKLIDEIVRIVEKDMQLLIHREGFNYSRFVTHLQYLLKRIRKQEQIVSGNRNMFESLKEEYKAIYECTEHIRSYLARTLHWRLNDEECLYLMLHINRVLSREDRQEDTPSS